MRKAWVLIYDKPMRGVVATDYNYSMDRVGNNAPTLIFDSNGELSELTTACLQPPQTDGRNTPPETLQGSK
jgi:hypothetical protein